MKSLYLVVFYFQTNRTQVQYDPLSEQQKYEIKQQVRRYVEGGLDEIDVSKYALNQGCGNSESLYLPRDK